MTTREWYPTGQTPPGPKAGGWCNCGAGHIHPAHLRALVGDETPGTGGGA